MWLQEVLPVACQHLDEAFFFDAVAFSEELEFHLDYPALVDFLHVVYINQVFEVLFRVLVGLL